MNKHTAIAFAAGLLLGILATAFAMRDYANTQSRKALAEAMGSALGKPAESFMQPGAFRSMVRDATGFTDEQLDAELAKQGAKVPPKDE